MIESKELYEFLVKGWVQILLIISGIAYFIQKGYELRLRKKEIKFSRLQENKILEIKSFYKSYQLLFLSLKQYAYQTEFGEHSDDIFRNIKETITQKLNEFDYNCMVVKLFIDKEDLETIDEIRDTFEQIRFGVAMWHNSQRLGHNSKDYDNKLTEIIDEIIPKKLPLLIKKIEYSLRRSFDLK